MMLAEHNRFRKELRGAVKEVIQDVKDGKRNDTVVLQVDFSTKKVHLRPLRRLRVFCATLICAGGLPGTITRKYADFIDPDVGDEGSTRRADFLYTALVSLRTVLNGFRKLVCVSDATCSEFRSNHCLFSSAVAAADLGLELSWMFLAPNHGYNDCDRHFRHLQLRIDDCRTEKGTDITEVDAIEAMTGAKNTTIVLLNDLVLATSSISRKMKFVSSYFLFEMGPVMRNDDSGTKVSLRKKRFPSDEVWEEDVIEGWMVRGTRLHDVQRRTRGSSARNQGRKRGRTVMSETELINKTRKQVNNWVRRQRRR